MAGLGYAYLMRATGAFAAVFLHAGNAGATGEHFGEGFDLDIAPSAGIKEGGPVHWLAVKNLSHANREQNGVNTFTGHHGERS